MTSVCHEKCCQQQCSGSLDDAVCALWWDEHLSTAWQSPLRNRLCLRCAMDITTSWDFSFLPLPCPLVPSAWVLGPFSFQAVLTVAIVTDGGIWAGGTDISLFSLHVGASLKSLFYYLPSSSGNASVSDSQDTRITEGKRIWVAGGSVNMTCLKQVFLSCCIRQLSVTQQDL